MGKIEEIPDEELLAQAHEQAHEQLHEGATVRLHALANAAEHNGKEGTLVAFDAVAGRWQVAIAHDGPRQSLSLRVRPANLLFVRARRAFQFAPIKRTRQGGKSNEKTGAAAQSQKGVSEELAQDAFEQVISELGPQLRKQLGYVEDAKCAEEEAVNDRVDAAVGETLQPLLDGIEAAAKQSASEAAFTDTVNQLIRDYFAKSSCGGVATLAARRRDLDEQYTKNHIAFSQVKESLGPKLRQALGHVASPSTQTEEAANQRIEAAADEILEPLLDAIRVAAEKCDSASIFTDTANKLTQKFFADGPGSADRIAAKRSKLEQDLHQTAASD